MSFTSWLRNLRSALALSRMEREHRRQRSLRATTHRPGLEVLEDRCLPSTFTVLNLLDSGPDSLRAAVAAANASPGADTRKAPGTAQPPARPSYLTRRDGVPRRPIHLRPRP